MKSIAIYQAYQDYEEQLRKELNWLGLKISKTFAGLFQVHLNGDEPPYTPWAANIWKNPYFERVDSVKDAVQKLCAIQRNWGCYYVSENSRTDLIQKNLPFIRRKPLEFLQEPKTSHIGSFALIDRNTMLYAAECLSSFPGGFLRFEEDRNGPPNRAYLKLWEIMARLKIRPQQTDKIVELGAAPGGWTYHLAGMSKQVVSFDRAPLSPDVLARHPHIDHRLGNAFNVTPDTMGDIDWLFSDLICYPEKLHELLEKWTSAGACKNYVLTVKFQGKDTSEQGKLFSNFPGAVVKHLHYNKNEWTFFLLGQDQSANKTQDYFIH